MYLWLGARRTHISQCHFIFCLVRLFCIKIGLELNPDRDFNTILKSRSISFLIFSNETAYFDVGPSCVEP